MAQQGLKLHDKNGFLGLEENS